MFDEPAKLVEIGSRDLSHGRAAEPPPLDEPEKARRLDSYDRCILAALQVRGDLGPAELSGLIKLSVSQCSRRLQRLKDEGYVTRVVALLNMRELGIGLVAYVQVWLKSHDSRSAHAFRERIDALPEVAECHAMAGEGDFLMKICTRDVDTFNALLANHILTAPDVGSARSSVVLRSLKSTTALPFSFV